MKKFISFTKALPFGNSFKVLGIVTFIYFCRYYFYKGVDAFIITPFKINEVEQSANLDILAVLILIILFGYLLFLILYKRQRPSLNSALNITYLIAFYCLVIRNSSVFSFESIGNYSLTYVDIVFISFLFFIAKFKYYGKTRKFESVNGFIEDDFHPEMKTDFLGRKKYALQIGLKILDTQPLNKAFVIAINSPWGFGKSGFLLLIEDFLKRKDFLKFDEEIKLLPNIYRDTQIDDLFLNHKQTIIVKYNPWKNFDDKKTVQDFFDELASSINQYDYQLSKKMKKYGSYLYKLDDSVFKKIVEVTIDSFQSEPTLTHLFDDINSSISRIKKKLIVFVDDMDRLTGDELLDILKLIRNTANFKNTFFIVAYDHNYVLNTIEKRNLISNKEEYLQKIVQLEVTLPIFQKNILLQYLDEEIKKYDVLNSYSQEIKYAITEVSGITLLKENQPVVGQFNSNELLDYLFRSAKNDDSLIFKVFLNVRDVVRFVNSFKLSFESIGRIGDLYEIVLLEFLKIKFLSIYQLVANKIFLKIENQKYEFDSNQFDEFWRSDSTNQLLNIRTSDIWIIRKILEVLFSPKRETKFRSVKFPRYFDIYFTFQAPKIISLEKIEAALKFGIDEVIKIVDEANANDTLDDFRSFLESQTNFSSKDDFEIILKTLFYIAKYDNRN